MYNVDHALRTKDFRGSWPIRKAWESLLRTPNEAVFHRNAKLLGLDRQFWADTFWGIWVIFGQFISHHLSVVRGVDLEEPSIHAWHTFDHKWSWREFFSWPKYTYTQHGIFKNNIYNCNVHFSVVFTQYQPLIPSQ